MTILPGSVPQNSTLQPPPAASVSDQFNPKPKPGNMIQPFELVGAKRAPYTDKGGAPKVSYKASFVLPPDYDSEYAEYIGRAVSIVTVTEGFFSKLKAFQIDPRHVNVPLMVEFKLVPSADGVKMTVLDFHLSPYQDDQLKKGIQPLTIDPPVKN